MKFDILFLQGAGVEAIGEEKPIVQQLQNTFGTAVHILHPPMPNADEPKYKPWKDAIESAINATTHPLILIGHSLGGSILLQHLCTTPPPTNYVGMILMGVPWWGTSEWEVEFKLPDNAGELLQGIEHIYIYHSKADEVIDFSYLEKYHTLLPGATIRPLDKIDHSYVGAIDYFIQDIRSLMEQYKK